MLPPKPQVQKTLSGTAFTRFLPATKATPKEMLPVVDKPAIQYVVEEAVAAGLSDVLIVTGRGKRTIEDHFDRSFELEYFLENKGKFDELKQVLQNLASFDEDKNPRTKNDLQKVFETLEDYYDKDLSYTLPISLGKVSGIIEQLAIEDGGSHFKVGDRSMQERATIKDLQFLLEKLNFHFTEGLEEQEKLDLDQTEIEGLF